LFPKTSNTPPPTNAIARYLDGTQINSFLSSREADALIGKGDDPYSLFVFISLALYIVKLFMTSRRLRDPPSLNETDQHGDNRKHQQDVNKPGHRVTAHQS